MSKFRWRTNLQRLVMGAQSPTHCASQPDRSTALFDRTAGEPVAGTPPHPSRSTPAWRIQIVRTVNLGYAPRTDSLTAFSREALGLEILLATEAIVMEPLLLLLYTQRGGGRQGCSWMSLGARMDCRHCHRFFESAPRLLRGNVNAPHPHRADEPEAVLDVLDRGDRKPRPARPRGQVGMEFLAERGHVEDERINRLVDGVFGYRYRALHLSWWVVSAGS